MFKDTQAYSGFSVDNIPKAKEFYSKRLFDLYGQGLTLQLEHLPQLIDQTEGVSATFIRELMRKAALFAAEESHDLVVEDRHLEEALKELVADSTIPIW